MAEAFLEEIYQEAKIITELKDIAQYALYHDSHNVVLRYNKIVSDVGEICKKYVNLNKKKAMELWRYFETLLDFHSNIMVIGDIINKKIIPLLEEYIALYTKIEVENNEGDYIFESTDSGFLTIKNVARNYYFHSTDDPMWEAKKLAEYIFDPKKNEYALWGCGLGYLAYQLYIISYGSIKINIFESDARMIEYAQNYGVLDWIPRENLNIIVDKDILPFLHCADRVNTAFHIFTPELDLVPDDVKSIFCNLNIEYSTEKKFKRIHEINFWRNIKSDAKLVSQFDTSSLSKEYVIIGAGPSLDETLEFVEQSKGKRTIVAVGTVFKKLIEKNIIPDMVVIMDPQERTYKQIEGIEDQKVPMLICLSAFWKFAATYQGDKYLIPTVLLPEMVEYAKQKNENMWGTGGTVTSLAMEAAIQFGATNVYLVGVDLAYPGGITHASNTMDRGVKNTDRMTPVKSVTGDIVYTEPNFILYREWIEERIKETPHIKYYNMSKIGAHIEGAENLI